MQTILVVAVSLAALVLFFYLKRPDISSASARSLVSQGAPLIDVRSPREYASGHIQGARNIPVDQIARRAAEVGPQEGPVIVYCASGARSAAAARALKGAGFQSVYNLGAMSNW